MENLYDYVIHYNHITQIWSAIPRDKYLEYWNQPKTDGVICAKDIKILIEVISKGIKND